MANLTEQQIFDAAVYELAITDPVMGGPGGVDNQPHQNLANRTAWLKQQVDALIAAGMTAADITAAINAHLAATDPHAQYTTSAEVLVLIAAEITHIPVGAAIPFFGGAVHAGFLKANGAAVLRASYAALFSEIGVLYGAGNGATTFNLPDSRGEFLRGWDDARGVDAGRALGSAQVDAIKSHRHTMSSMILQSVLGGALAIPNSYSGTAWGLTSFFGGVETRPRNLAVQFLIKY